MAKIKITQKEYDKLLKQVAELAELKKQAKEKTVLINELEKANTGLHQSITGYENELDKKSKLLKISNDTIDELKKELSETKETVSQLSTKISELSKENTRLSETEKAYNGMKQAVKTVIAHSK